jgi:hypothetical protein
MKSKTQQTANVRAAVAKAHVDKIKMDKGCSRCGYKEHPVALHFNHIHPCTKDRSVSKLVQKGSMEPILREIAKCEILCANCHAIHTFANKHYLSPA